MSGIISWRAMDYCHNFKYFIFICAFIFRTVLSLSHVFLWIIKSYCLQTNYFIVCKKWFYCNIVKHFLLRVCVLTKHELIKIGSALSIELDFKDISPIYYYYLERSFDICVCEAEELQKHIWPYYLLHFLCDTYNYISIVLVIW